MGFYITSKRFRTSGCSYPSKLIVSFFGDVLGDDFGEIFLTGSDISSKLSLFASGT